MLSGTVITIKPQFRYTANHIIRFFAIQDTGQDNIQDNDSQGMKQVKITSKLLYCLSEPFIMIPKVREFHGTLYTALYGHHSDDETGG